MAQNIAHRFAGWLGSWAGAIELRDGESGLVSTDFLPVFNGDAIEMHVLITDTDGVSVMNRGVGLWSLHRGAVRSAVYGDWIGFAILNEVPDDPEALALSGPLSDGRVLTTAFCLKDGELVHTSSVTEGYSGRAHARTVARMRRRASLQPELR